MDGTKRCPYCLRPHNGRARACSEWCERRIAGRAAWITRSRREAVARELAELVESGAHRSHWRYVAMGDNEAGHLSKVFGVQLSIEATCAAPAALASRQEA